MEMKVNLDFIYNAMLQHAILPQSRKFCEPVLNPLWVISSELVWH